MSVASPYTLLSTAFKWLPVYATALMAVGCADNTFDSSSLSKNEIRFEVSTTNGWNAGQAITRGDADKTLSVITLSSGDTKLYLVPLTEDMPLTRGTQLDNTNMENFGVFASIAGTESGPDYMCNEEVTSENGWAPVHNYLWPGNGNLHINAYAPYVSQPQTAGGILSIPVPTDKGDLQINYTVPADVAAQQDLMWSTPCDANASPCELTFNHALTAIRFSAGAELAPCTIKEISIKGVANSGTLNIENGEWSGTTGSANYTLSPDLTLTASEGETYVTAGTPITEGDNTLLLMPQDLGSDASVVLSIDINGTETVLEASLNGEMWGPGKTITYNLSANPNQEVLVLDVTGDFASTYTGGTDNFAVTSHLIKNGSTTPVNWIAEFVDDNGNVIERPEWIVDMTSAGEGNTDCTTHTTVQNLVFEQISPQSQVLQNTADINTSSGNTPYNLASSTGQVAIENTANTYIIHAPGKYSLPLVYGNAIRNGAENSSAYIATTHSRYALKNFVNHLGNGITDPYIYNNSGCEPSDAVLLWEDGLSLVKNVALSSDGKNIEFDIPQNSIRQGNALIAVRDKTGAIMWSWQLWITDYAPANETVGITVSGTTYKLYTRSVGDIIGGDVTNFAPRSVLVRFTQTDVPDGLEPLQKTVKFTQSGVTITTPNCFTYYQWGRKDPMMSEMMQWYDEDHNVITTLTLEEIQGNLPAGESVEQCWILTPTVFWECAHTYNFEHTNLWNTNLSETAPVKTIYDPSPLGSMMPTRTLYRELTQSGTLDIQASNTDSRKAGFYFTVSDGEVYFPMFGYREGTTGGIANAGTVGEYWSSYPVNRSEGGALVLRALDATTPATTEQEPRAHGFGVRPMLEP